MACIRQSDINMQCKVYDSLLILPGDIQAARGLMCTSITLAVLAVLVSVLGIRRTNCWDDGVRAKNVILVVGGCLFIVASLVTLLPWPGPHTTSSEISTIRQCSSRRSVRSDSLSMWALSPSSSSWSRVSSSCVAMLPVIRQKRKRLSLQ